MPKMPNDAQMQYINSALSIISTKERKKRDRLEDEIARLNELCGYLADRVERLDKTVARFNHLEKVDELINKFQPVLCRLDDHIRRLDRPNFIVRLLGKIFGKRKGGLPMRRS